MTEMNNTRELAANIIDIFEDFLASIGKVIPCSDPDTEEERAENDDAAAIYGEEYYALEDTVVEVLESKPKDTSKEILAEFDSLLENKNMNDCKPQGEQREKILASMSRMLDNNDSAKARYTELCTKAKTWGAAYYENDAPAVTDAEYDAVMHEIRDIEARHPDFVTPDSPTQVVGGKRIIGIPVVHHVPMLSLLDVFSDEEVRSFVDSVKAEFPDATFSVERKIDGLSLSMVYERATPSRTYAHLVQASTRGDGHVGEDVTENVAALSCLPYSIELPEGINKIELRGECYMSEQDFETTNAKQAEAGKKLFANPRNCAAGSLRQADPAIARERNLQVFIFNVQSVNDGDAAQFGNSHFDQLEYLRKGCQFKTTGFSHCENADAVLDAIKHIGDTRYDVDYPIDGAVVKVNELDIRQKMGERTKTPNGLSRSSIPPKRKELFCAAFSCRRAVPAASLPLLSLTPSSLPELAWSVRRSITPTSSRHSTFALATLSSCTSPATSSPKSRWWNWKSVQQTLCLMTWQNRFAPFAVRLSRLSTALWTSTARTIPALQRL